jgi:hypothetical protein
VLAVADWFPVDPRIQRALAIPEPVVRDEFVILPPPPVTVQVTEAPGTGFWYWSRT